jgi:hypothetical protein
MSDTPKKDNLKEQKDDTPPKVDDSSWSEDISRREYYYDDATGYEVYDEDSDADDEV